MYRTYNDLYSDHWQEWETALNDILSYWGTEKAKAERDDKSEMVIDVLGRAIEKHVQGDTENNMRYLREYFIEEVMNLCIAFRTEVDLIADLRIANKKAILAFRKIEGIKESTAFKIKTISKSFVKYREELTEEIDKLVKPEKL